MTLILKRDLHLEQTRRTYLSKLVRLCRPDNKNCTRNQLHSFLSIGRHSPKIQWKMGLFWTLWTQIGLEFINPCWMHQKKSLLCLPISYLEIQRLVNLPVSFPIFNFYSGSCDSSSSILSKQGYEDLWMSYRKGLKIFGQGSKGLECFSYLVDNKLMHLHDLWSLYKLFNSLNVSTILPTPSIPTLWRFSKKMIGLS